MNDREGPEKMTADDANDADDEFEPPTINRLRSNLRITSLLRPGRELGRPRR
ncbi:hypothetical protein [Halorussus caseinilyticus]|uniref:hypothetical protein n=1 Tax=Halorussus caseinilyticus TaxID=3034025 RepID=UPI0023E83793|nr:hypothetical protein [Halorussus sp. DT72]